MKIFNSRKQKLIGLTAGVLVLLCLWLAWPPTEPSHQGMTLSECLAAQNPTLPGYSRERAVKAGQTIRDMGPKAVSHLVRMLKTKPSFFRDVHQMVHHQLGWYEGLLPIHEIHWRAVIGLSILGPQAKPAADEVILLLYEPDNGMRQRYFSLLDSMELEAERMIPLLRHALNDPSGDVLNEALKIAIRRGTEMSPALPFQTRLLQHPDFHIRSQALSALMATHPRNTNALLPLLKTQLTDTHPMTRGRAMVAYFQYESDVEKQKQELTRLLADADVCVRFKATNLVREIPVPQKAQETDHTLYLHEVSPSDLLFVYERATGKKFLLSSGVQFKGSISMDTFGFLSLNDSVELMKLVLKEKVGWDFHTLPNGDIHVIQGTAPSPPRP